MKLKLKHLTIALAVGALVAVLGSPDLADARGGGGGGGHGGGFGGGGRGAFGGGGMGMRGPGAMSFSRSGAGYHSFGVTHGSRFYSQGFHAGTGSRRFNRSYSAGHFSGRANRVTNTGISRRTVGIASTQRGTIANRNLRQLSSNRSVQTAAFTRHNAFFNSRFGARGFSSGWRDHYGRGYGYRWAGGVFWPYWFGDYYSYAFWPDDYYDTYWGYGPDFDHVGRLLALWRIPL